jgi:hypothetical protein
LRARFGDWRQFFHAYVIWIMAAQRATLQSPRLITIMAAG